MKKSATGRPEKKHVRRCEVNYRLIVVLLSLCLLLLSAGCSNTRTVYEPGQCVRLPAELLQPTPVPYPSIRGEHMSYGEATEWAYALLDALDSANKDKAALQKSETEREKANHVEK